MARPTLSRGGGGRPPPREDDDEAWERGLWTADASSAGRRWDRERGGRGCDEEEDDARGTEEAELLRGMEPRRGGVAVPSCGGCVVESPLCCCCCCSADRVDRSCCSCFIWCSCCCCVRGKPNWSVGAPPPPPPPPLASRCTCTGGAALSSWKELLRR